ncbi:P-loop containing nucleoside triphosphate hydrolase protein [Pisolithus sp. B1]|nr:P-loop containing nucleoside triphosphate hydrolase protein [Pisolithus sp. B1]
MHAARDAQEEVEECLKRGIQQVIIPVLDKVATMKTRVQFEQGCFHFAVAGVVGSGKSWLIEIRVKDGVVNILTPTFAFVWYDIPGAGTLQQPDWLYFNTQGVFVFDCIIVLFNNCFMEMDTAILMNCMRLPISTCIVRSKGDVHILNIMQKDGYDNNHDDTTVCESLFPSAHSQFIMQMRVTIKKNLKEAGLPDQRVYMVSNKTLLSIVKDRSLRFPHRIINKLELIKDVLDEACSHHCGVCAEDDDCPV